MDKELEKAANNWVTQPVIGTRRESFIAGAKWQMERSYSEEEVIKLLISCKNRFGGSELYDYTHDDEVKEWFEYYKKK